MGEQLWKIITGIAVTVFGAALSVIGYFGKKHLDRIGKNEAAIEALGHRLDRMAEAFEARAKEVEERTRMARKELRGELRQEIETVEDNVTHTLADYHAKLDALSSRMLDKDDLNAFDRAITASLDGFRETGRLMAESMTGLREEIRTLSKRIDHIRDR